jgi:hypothetical protein
MRRPEVSGALDEIVLRCLAKDPTKRYQDADALCGALLKGPWATDPSRTAAPAGIGRPQSRLRPSARTRTRPAASSGAIAARSRDRRRLLVAPMAAMLLIALLLALALTRGSGGSGRVSAGEASAAQPGDAPARSHGSSSARGPIAATTSAGAGGRAGTTSAAVPSPAQGHAPASTPASPPSNPLAALSALVQADLQQGLIDPNAAEAISTCSAALLQAISSQDPQAAASELSEFASRVDLLAADGGIATPATAGALKAAATGAVSALTLALRASEPVSGSTSSSDGSGEASPPAEGDGAARRHDSGEGSHD